jgi:hypothetical protein
LQKGAPEGKQWNPWISSDTLVLTTNKLDNNKIHHSTFSNSLKYFVSFFS